MELWRDYGISAYNMATSSETLGMTEQILKLCIQTHKPKSRSSTYITSINRTIWNGTYSYRHLFFDAVPLSPAKV